MIPLFIQLVIQVLSGFVLVLLVGFLLLLTMLQ